MLVGGLAGVAATVVMTSFMARAHQVLPQRLRYELPPREIVERVARVRGEASARDITLGAHFAFGALAGVLLALSPVHSVVKSSVYGLLVWTGSYLGWIPLFRILRPAHEHPAERNALTLAAHAVWGISAAIAIRELRNAAHGAFSKQPRTRGVRDA